MLRLSLFSLALLSFQTACTQDDVRQDEEIQSSSVDEAVAAPVVGTEDAGVDAKDDGGSVGSVVVRFKYDDAVLTAEDKVALNAAAEKLKSNQSFKIQVVGHTDERGSIEYNLALGERRAQAVREYLNSLGVSGGQITTMSMGEEQPVADGHDESAWGQNRRANIQTISR